MASQTSPKDDARGWRIRARLRALYHGSSRQAVRFRFTVLIIDIVIIGFFIAAPILLFLGDWRERRRVAVRVEGAAA